jgi:hypothetical protein
VCQESVIIWSKFDTPTTRNLDAEVGQGGGDEERKVPEEGEAAGPYQMAQVWRPACHVAWGQEGRIEEGVEEGS